MLSNFFYIYFWYLLSQSSFIISPASSSLLFSNSILIIVLISFFYNYYLKNKYIYYINFSLTIFFNLLTFRLFYITAKTQHFCVSLGHLVYKENFIMFIKPVSLTQKMPHFCCIVNEPQGSLDFLQKSFYNIDTSFLSFFLASYWTFSVQTLRRVCKLDRRRECTIL